MVEQLGSGVPRILRAYPNECFSFGDSHFEALKEKGVIKRIGGTRGIGVINLKEK